jgi:Fe2+ transport system protein FeoA
MNTANQKNHLSDYRPGESAVVKGFVSIGTVLHRRLMELGFIEGTVVTVRHEAPLGRDPVAYLVRGMTVALRKDEASQIIVQIASRG